METASYFSWPQLSLIALGAVISSHKCNTVTQKTKGS